MAFCHYWRLTEPGLFDRETNLRASRSAITVLVQLFGHEELALELLRGRSGAGPFTYNNEGTDLWLEFNGDAAKRLHEEAFAFSLASLEHGDMHGVNTGGKPYDTFVVASLAVFKFFLGPNLEVFSDRDVSFPGQVFEESLFARMAISGINRLSYHLVDATTSPRESSRRPQSAGNNRNVFNSGIALQTSSRRSERPIIPVLPLPQPEPQVVRHCLGCGNTKQPNGNPKLLRCSQCKWAYFCSPECQEQVWPTHQQNCFPVESDATPPAQMQVMRPLGSAKALGAPRPLRVSSLRASAAGSVRKAAPRGRSPMPSRPPSATSQGSFRTPPPGPVSLDVVPREPYINMSVEDLLRVVGWNVRFKDNGKVSCSLSSDFGADKDAWSRFCLDGKENRKYAALELYARLAENQPDRKLSLADFYGCQGVVLLCKMYIAYPFDPREMLRLPLERRRLYEIMHSISLVPDINSRCEEYLDSCES
eukprot:Rmarinus@m.301